MKRKVILILDVDDTSDEPRKMWSADEEDIEEALLALDIVENVELIVIPPDTDSVEIGLGDDQYVIGN
jgi:CRISPR/Cas system-associated protein Cas7 (RAMP superfamily)